MDALVTCFEPAAFVILMFLEAILSLSHKGGEHLPKIDQYRIKCNFYFNSYLSQSFYEKALTCIFCQIQAGEPARAVLSAPCHHGFAGAAFIALIPKRISYRGSSVQPSLRRLKAASLHRASECRQTIAPGFNSSRTCGTRSLPGEPCWKHVKRKSIQCR